MRSKKLSALVFLLFPTLLLGQLKQDTKVNMAQAIAKPKVDNIISLLGLDPANFSMSHSYSFSVGSLGGNSYNMGLYLNTMKYRLSDLLTFHLQLGMQHQPFGNQTAFGPKSQIFISSAGVEYKPSDSLKLQVLFSQSPGSSYYRSPFNDPISRNRAWLDRRDEEDE
ncbi:MAG: hypothetical protein ACE5IY_10635 [bacterium]